MKKFFVKYLIKNGVDVNKANYDDNTLLTIACEIKMKILYMNRFKYILYKVYL